MLFIVSQCPALSSLVSVNGAKISVVYPEICDCCHSAVPCVVNLLVQYAPALYCTGMHVDYNNSAELGDRKIFLGRYRNSFTGCSLFRSYKLLCGPCKLCCPFPYNSGGADCRCCVAPNMTQNVFIRCSLNEHIIARVFSEEITNYNTSICS